MFPPENTVISWSNFDIAEVLQAFQYRNLALFSLDRRNNQKTFTTKPSSSNSQHSAGLMLQLAAKSYWQNRSKTSPAKHRTTSLLAEVILLFRDERPKQSPRM